jgi:hypothetical protein
MTEFHGDVDIFSVKKAGGPGKKIRGGALAIKLNPQLNGGHIYLKETHGKDTVIIKASGDLYLYDHEGHRGFALLSRAPSLSEVTPTTGMWIGASPKEGPKAGIVYIRGVDGNESIKLDGAAGDIILNNADCAEDFDVTESDGIEPGTVMVIDDGGSLKMSNREYDKRVAGVISGALGYKPGIILDKSYCNIGRRSVSLMGKTYCKVDPTYSPIEVGDLLTTSNTPGHAMKAVDSTKSFGSVIGKALRPMEQKPGLIPILVTLQ